MELPAGQLPVTCALEETQLSLKHKRDILERHTLWHLLHKSAYQIKNRFLCVPLSKLQILGLTP